MISGFVYKKDLSFLILLVENISSLLSILLLISELLYFPIIGFVFHCLPSSLIERMSRYQLDSTTLNGGARALCGIGSPAARQNSGLEYTYYRTERMYFTVSAIKTSWCLMENIYTFNYKLKYIFVSIKLLQTCEIIVAHQQEGLSFPCLH